MKIGANVSISGNGILSAIEETLSYEANAFMIYTRSNRGGAARAIKDMKLEEALVLMEENNLDINYGVVHAPYYINLAGAEKAKNIGKIVLKEEIERTEELGIKYLVFHPGSHVKLGVEEGIKNIIESLNEILTGEEKTYVCLEMMASDGTKVGNTIEEIKQIINGLEESKRKKIGVCLDTCHLYSSGYDITQGIDNFLEEFDKEIGKEYIKVLHLNGSKNGLGTKKDRHANIGAEDEFIGKENLRKIANHEFFNDKPVILETPFGQYKEEIDYIRGNDNAKLSNKSLK